MLELPPQSAEQRRDLTTGVSSYSSPVISPCDEDCIVMVLILAIQSTLMLAEVGSKIASLPDSCKLCLKHKKQTSTVASTSE